jgi:cytochrome c biogenesis protein CcdA
MNRGLWGIISCFILLLLVLPLISAQTVNSCLQNAKNDPTKLYFFYGDGCSHCAAAEPFLQELEEKYNLTIIYHEIWNNDTNKQVFEEFLVDYKVPKGSWGVPAFFMEPYYVVGFDNKDSKGKDLEEIVKTNLGLNGVQGDAIRLSLFGKNIEISKDSSLIFLAVVLGFADGFNPCTFSILIFLMAYLFTLSASKKKILKLGLAFSSVIFIVYIAIMLGLINLLAFTGFKTTGKLIVASILIIMGLIDVKDFFFHGKGPSLEIPKFARPLLEKYVRMATLPAIIALALILSFVELLCTLGLPLAYVGILAEREIIGISSFFYILLYNLFYIIPMLTVIFLVYFLVLETEKAEHYRQKLRDYMKLIGGLLMILLAVAMLLGWF